MNDKIKLLAELAKFAIDVSNDPNSPPSWWAAGHNECFEKFAELIVRECINKIETYQISVGNSAAGEMACDWTYDALKEIRDEIKQHFGVEE